MNKCTLGVPRLREYTRLAQEANIKFIHTGDIHWGMCPDINKPWGKERALAIKNTFRTIIENTKETGMDYLFISGDLFHRQPLMKNLKEIDYLFSTAPSVKIIIIASNHDRIRDSSALLSFTWSPNVTFLMSGNLTSVYFEDINAEVHGFSYHRAKIREPLLDNIQVPLNSRIQILMAHGGDLAHLPISFNSLELSPFSCIALGHVHKPHIVVEGKVAYCGSPEPLDLTETGPHGYYMGEIHPVIRKLLSLKFIPTSSLQYVPLVVNVSKDTTNGELSDRIAREIQSCRERNVYRFRLEDMRGPETEFDLEQLSSRFRIAEVIDDSGPRYNFSALFTEHSSDMIGFYIQALQRDDMGPMEKKALYYGVNTLLRTTDGRS